MSELTDWIKRIKAIETGNHVGLASNFRRLIAPGWEPIDFEGFLRAQGQAPLPTFNGTPSTFSVLQWLDIPQSNTQTLSELPSQVGALMSLVADRKITVLDELDIVQQGVENKHIFLPIHQHADARLVSPLEADDAKMLNARFVEQLSKLCSLPVKQQTTITEAMSLHYGAVLLYERDLAAAYTLVVAGIETLSRAFGTAPTGWGRWDEAEKWDEFMKDIGLSGVQKEQLRARLMKDKHIRLKETFVNYVVQELPDSMWDEDWKEWLYTIDSSKGDYVKDGGSWVKNDKVRDHLTTDREQLRAAIKKSYDARSGFVHEGKRSVNFLTQIQGMTAPDYTKPLAFSLLRTILSTLIKHELEKRSTGFSIPSIDLRH